MVKNYETVFILTPVLSDEQMKETVKKVTTFLKEKKCKLLHEEKWGLRKLAYPIQKKSTGFYYLLEFEGEGSTIAELEVLYKRDERIIRFLTFAQDKHSIAYNNKRRAKNAEKVELVEKPEKTEKKEKV